MKGRAVVVTGAFGELGRVVAAEAAARGARVAALGHGAKPPDDLADRLAPEGFALGGVDLGSPESARAAMAEAKAKFGRLDALLNIAGGFGWRKIADDDPANWERLFALNVMTTLNATQAALPYLLESGSGRIVNVGAAAAVKGGVGIGAYAASKAGVLRLTESLAEELKGRGVTVNAVLPSIIDTPANRVEMPNARFDRWVAAADLAAVILFLASREAGAVTGAAVPVFGGV